MLSRNFEKKKCFRRKATKSWLGMPPDLLQASAWGSGRSHVSVHWPPLKPCCQDPHVSYLLNPPLPTTLQRPKFPMLQRTSTPPMRKNKSSHYCPLPYIVSNLHYQQLLKDLHKNQPKDIHYSHAAKTYSEQHGEKISTTDTSQIPQLSSWCKTSTTSHTENLHFLLLSFTPSFLPSFFGAIFTSILPSKERRKRPQGTPNMEDLQGRSEQKGEDTSNW